jgi:hypothetical protein
MEASLSFTIVVAVAVLLFGLLGFRRGWLREVSTLAGLLVAWLILVAAASPIINVLNRLYWMIRFTAAGGFDSDSPAAVVQELRHQPLVDPRHPGVFLAALFCILAVVAFVAANRFAPPAASAAARGIGVLVGIANGYLVAYLGLRYLSGAGLAGPLLSANPTGVVDLLSRYLPTVLLVGVVLAIAIALLSSRQLGGRPSSRAASSRAKG